VRFNHVARLLCLKIKRQERNLTVLRGIAGHNNTSAPRANDVRTLLEPRPIPKLLPAIEVWSEVGVAELNA
jgi:hypothetical protein